MSILHADLDAFFASVEQRDDPSLRGRPVIVGGGVVLAASYEAKAHGVCSAMGARAARRLCPEAVVVPPRFHAYLEASRAVFGVFEDHAPVVEALSIDEAFLDVRGMERSFGAPLDLARALRADVRERTGLPLTVGIATTKFLAKVASGVAKPDGLLRVPPGRELAFLHPLPVERLWGVGPVTASRLHAFGLTRVADVAELSEQMLVSLLGRGAGRHLHALAHNRDPRTVARRRRRGSVGAQRARGRRPWTPEELDADVVALVDRVARRLRGADRAGRTVTLRLRFGDYTPATRSRTLAQPTAATDVVLSVVRRLLVEALPLLEERGVTLVGVAVSNLADARSSQLALALDGNDRDSLDSTLDGIRRRFGTASVTRAVLVGRRELEPPLLED